MSTPLPYPEKVTLNSSFSKKNVVIIGQFGEGYQQVAWKGINPSRDTWTIELKPLTYAQKMEYESFFKTVGNWGLVSWTPSFHTSPKIFKLTGTPSIKQTSFSTYTVSLSLEEV